MLSTISATELTHNTKTVIRQVVSNKQPILVMNYHEPVAVIIDYPSWQALTRKPAPRLAELLKYMGPNTAPSDLTKTIRKMRDAE
jgi:prevent-host-death family protein